MSSLQRVVGLPGAVFIGLGSIVGTGAFVALGLAAEPAGSWVPLAVVVAAALAACNGLSSAALAATFPVAGGTYEYGYRVLSPLWGRAAGTGFLVAKTLSASTASLGFAAYLGMGTEVSLTLIATLTLAILAGLRRTQWINAALVGTTLLALAAFVATGVGEWAPPLPSSPGLGGILEGASLIFVAFTGYGRVATLGEEIQNPGRNIPRAVVLTLAVALVLYLSVSWVALGLGGAVGFYQGALAGNPLEQLATHRLPVWVGWALRIGAVTAMAGVSLNLILGLSRVVLAMGRRGDLPKVFGVVSSGGTPVAATLAVALFVALGAWMGTISVLWSLSAVTVLGYYAITNAAALGLGELPLSRWVPWTGLVGCLVLSLSIRSGTFFQGVGIWAVALILVSALSRLTKRYGPTL